MQQVPNVVSIKVAGQVAAEMFTFTVPSLYSLFSHLISLLWAGKGSEK